MKPKINLLNLNSKADVSRKEMENLRMGVGSYCANHSCCACGCKYELTGGSNTDDNYEANSLRCLYSPGVDYENADFKEEIW